MLYLRVAMKNSTSFFIFLVLLNFNLTRAQTAKSKKITYDFSCLDSETTNWLGDMEKELIATVGVPAKFSDEVDAGVQVLDECKKEYTFISSGVEYEQLQAIITKLKKQIQGGRGFNYKLYYIDDPMINAFTAGGKIFFTKGMFDFCKDEHEIACILAHEIAHNELGHIKEGIAKSKTYDEYIGKHFGSFSVFVANLITLSFNQKNEAHCDMWGIDLAYRCNYLPCHTVSLWKRMKTIEGDTPDDLSAMLSTHPYSGRRAECVKNHLKTNYKINCTE